MKKKITVIIVLLLLIFIIGQIKKAFIKKYIIIYQKNHYQIKEYYQQANHPAYSFIITNNKDTYVYNLNDNFHKKKKVIKEIKTYQKNNLSCIIPIYKKETEKKLYCSLDKNQVSNDYLIKSNNKDFLFIQKKVKSYHIAMPSSEETAKQYKKITIYHKNISSEDIFYIWNYKGIDVISNDHIKTKKFFNEDHYDNILATTIKNYYVLFDNSSVEGIKKIYYYNYKKNKLNSFNLKNSLSKDSYINGVIDDLIYVTDKKEKKQYTINIEKKKIVRIDQDETSYLIFENGKKNSLSKSDFFMKEQYFSNINKKNSKITSSNELREENNIYYYIENNNMYQSLKINPSHKIRLFELNDIKEWYIVDNEIILLQNDTIYTYQEKTGLRKILQSNELKYNYKNIYKIGKK